MWEGGHTARGLLGAEDEQCSGGDTVWPPCRGVCGCRHHVLVCPGLRAAGDPEFTVAKGTRRRLLLVGAPRKHISQLRSLTLSLLLSSGWEGMGIEGLPSILVTQVVVTRDSAAGSVSPPGGTRVTAGEGAMPEVTGPGWLLCEGRSREPEQSWSRLRTL